MNVTLYLPQWTNAIGMESVLQVEPDAIALG